MKKFFVFALLAAVLAGCAVAPATDVKSISTDAASASNAGTSFTVKLKNAQGFTSHYVPFFYVRGTVLVANLGYSKVVGIRYSSDNWATYTDFDGEFAGSENGYDRFRVQSYATVSPSIKFAVYYKVNGQTYWDNNNGANYEVTSTKGVINPLEVQLTEAKIEYYYSGFNMNTTVKVKNLSPTKKVNIVYTIDGVTYSTPIAYSAASTDGYEIWKGVVILPPGFNTAVKFAVSYDVNGTTYWDNQCFYDYYLDNGSYKSVKIAF
jgi:hypothetical protein